MEQRLSCKVKMNRKIEMNRKIDKSVVAGVVIRAGMVIDGSVRGRLERLADALQAYIRGPEHATEFHRNQRTDQAAHCSV
ncbi:MAG: ATP synthase subunit delta [Sodalis sp.]|nr:MAG: ATP synthase subunit delta [Sodalis sp.]